MKNYEVRTVTKSMAVSCTCDVCNKTEPSQGRRYPRNWIELDLDVDSTETSMHVKTEHYCSITCLIKETRNQMLIDKDATADYHHHEYFRDDKVSDILHMLVRTLDEMDQ